MRGQGVIGRRLRHVLDDCFEGGDIECAGADHEFAMVRFRGGRGIAGPAVDGSPWLQRGMSR